MSLLENILGVRSWRKAPVGDTEIAAPTPTPNRTTREAFDSTGPNKNVDAETARMMSELVLDLRKRIEHHNNRLSHPGYAFIIDSGEIAIGVDILEDV